MARSKRRMSSASMDVLAYLAADIEAHRYGLEMAKALSLSSGTLYPILQRFEDEKWIEGLWEEADPAETKRPRRRLYKLTPNGVQVARSELKAASRRLGVLDPGWST